VKYFLGNNNCSWKCNILGAYTIGANNGNTSDGGSMDWIWEYKHGLFVYFGV